MQKGKVNHNTKVLLRFFENAITWIFSLKLKRTTKITLTATITAITITTTKRWTATSTTKSTTIETTIETTSEDKQQLNNNENKKQQNSIYFLLMLLCVGRSFPPTSLPFSFIISCFSSFFVFFFLILLLAFKLVDFVHVHCIILASEQTKSHFQVTREQHNNNKQNNKTPMIPKKHTETTRTTTTLWWSTRNNRTQTTHKCSSNCKPYHQKMQLYSEWKPLIHCMLVWKGLPKWSSQ